MIANASTRLSELQSDVKDLDERIRRVEEEYAEEQRIWQDLERMWDEIDHLRGGLTAGEVGARAVDEDRGE